jgi:hypothetical protein
METKKVVTKEQADAILSKRIPVTTPDKYKVTVTSINESYVEREFSTQTHIINVNAWNPQQMEQALIAYSEGRYADALNTSLSASVRDIDYKPEKGESIEIEVAPVETKDGVQLRIVSFIKIKAKVVKPLDWAATLEKFNKAKEPAVEKRVDVLAEEAPKFEEAPATGKVA